MKQTLLDYMVCPLDRARLTLAVQDARGEWIERGVLTCAQCGETFRVENGIPNMLSSRLPGIESKRAEISGWLEMARKENWYAASDEFDLALPYVVQKLGWDPQGASNWEATRLTLEQLFREYLRPGMRVLEVGAAKSWAGHYFLERGCEYTACDILDDAYIGIGRARFFAEHFGYYEVAVADGEALPFRDGHFDLVFAIAALHHALDLDKMIGEMARVAKPGAYVVGLNEGVRALWANGNATVQAEAKTHGINEHVQSLWTYTRAFRAHGLHVTQVTRSVGYDSQIAPKLKIILDGVRRVPYVGEQWAPWLLLGWIHPYDGASFFAVKTQA